MNDEFEDSGWGDAADDDFLDLDDEDLDSLDASDSDDLADVSVNVRTAAAPEPDEQAVSSPPSYAAAAAAAPTADDAPPKAAIVDEVEVDFVGAEWPTISTDARDKASDDDRQSQADDKADNSEADSAGDHEWSDFEQEEEEEGAEEDVEEDVEEHLEDHAEEELEGVGGAETKEEEEEDVEEEEEEEEEEEVTNDDLVLSRDDSVADEEEVESIDDLQSESSGESKVEVQVEPPVTSHAPLPPAELQITGAGAESEPDTDEEVDAAPQPKPERSPLPSTSPSPSREDADDDAAVSIDLDQSEASDYEAFRTAISTSQMSYAGIGSSTVPLTESSDADSVTVVSVEDAAAMPDTKQAVTTPAAAAPAVASPSPPPSILEPPSSLAPTSVSLGGYRIVPASSYGTGRHVVFTLEVAAGEDERWTVERRFSEFVWLRETLLRQLPGCLVPPLPDKQIVGRFGAAFLEARRVGLSLFLDAVLEHPLLGQSGPFVVFLARTTDDWTAGRAALNSGAMFEGDAAATHVPARAASPSLLSGAVATGTASDASSVASAVTTAFMSLWSTAASTAEAVVAPYAPAVATSPSSRVDVDEADDEVSLRAHATKKNVALGNVVAAIAAVGRASAEQVAALETLATAAAALAVQTDEEAEALASRRESKGEDDLPATADLTRTLAANLRSLSLACRADAHALAASTSNLDTSVGQPLSYEHSVTVACLDLLDRLAVTTKEGERERGAAAAAAARAQRVTKSGASSSDRAAADAAADRAAARAQRAVDRARVRRRTAIGEVERERDRGWQRVAGVVMEFGSMLLARTLESGSVWRSFVNGEVGGGSGDDFE